ncbi:class I SAM-dependent methyltransferase [Actinomadura rupiterrae]|uniref:class I SAM-dependent methyltransferase n=1 Tax=Actinomadura rupiterrae TaxID=559627 RepID=UPI0020A3C601|nr:class I SAM-dependent methyltransferase [Actinomadura rupiterrae]MCP2336789.1 cyclopropane-fatty-acyl-phospholipid synthase [Actinomadura rupiterrae]
MSEGVAGRLGPLLARIMLGEADAPVADLPIRVRAWDGSSVGPSGAPVFVVRHRRALRRLLWKPGEIGLVRAYVAGELDIEGDVFDALEAVQQVMRIGDEPIRLTGEDKREIVRTAVLLGAVGTEPRPPAEEFTPGDTRSASRSSDARPTASRSGDTSPAAGRSGDTRSATGRSGDARSSTGRSSDARDAASRSGDTSPGAGRSGDRRSGDARAGLGPLDAPADFFTQMLGPSLATSTGLWDQAVDLDDAQRASLEAVADRLGLFSGARVLDLSGGWGAFAHHAAAEHGARVVALVRTPEQAEHIRKRSADLPVDPRVGDLAVAGDGPYDAIAGLAGVDALDPPAERLYSLLAPGGRLLLQQQTRRPGPHQIRRTFTTSYMFPTDGELRTLGSIVAGLEESGLEVRGTLALREHHARTLRAWAAALRLHWPTAVEQAGAGRARVWLLYLAASALACESGRIGVHAITAVRRDRDGRAGTTLVEDRAVLRR